MAHPPFNNPFAGLADKLGMKPEASDSRSKKPSKEPPKPGTPARAVIRYERKGRGGKEVTLVEKLELRPAELTAWLKELKQSLGTGGSVEGQSLVLQGDQRERLRVLLEKRGVRQISVSG
jgi:translation initiation factor 1